MPSILATYDHTGPVDYMQTFNAAVENFAALTVGGGTYPPLLCDRSWQDRFNR